MEYHRTTLPPEIFFDVKALVESELKVKESFIAFSVPTFVIEPGPVKEPFQRLVRKMKEKRWTPFLRKDGENFVVRVFRSPALKPLKIWPNIVLFIVTVGTMLLAGYMQSISYSQLMMKLGRVGIDSTLTAFLFALSLLAILGLHELGHKIASEWSGIELSMPYFIPSPPPPYGIGTFGAIIVQREHPVNRDQLFDIGFSGPFISFIVMVIVAIIGFQLSHVAPRIPEVGVIPAPLIFHLLSYTRPLPPGFVIYPHPILFVAWIGAILIFLNTLPAWQLDGGHVARATLGPRMHRILSMLSTILLLFSGWLLWALPLLMLASRAHPGPLDDVSPLSNSRKVIFVVILIIVLLCFSLSPIYW